MSSFSENPNLSCGSPKHEKSNYILGFLSSNGGHKKRSTSQPRGSCNGKTTPLLQPNVDNAGGELNGVNSLKKKYASGENMLRKSLWLSRSKIADIVGKENTEIKSNTDMHIDNKFNNDAAAVSADTKIKGGGAKEETQNYGIAGFDGSEDMVSAFLYDRLQREVISLRKSCEVKNNTLAAKDDEIKVNIINPPLFLLPSLFSLSRY